MSLAEFRGAPNTTDLFRCLVGDTVKACFCDKEGRIWILMTCGHAVVFAATTGGTPAYWHEMPDGVQRVVGERTAELKQKMLELRNSAPGIDF